jgi:hypothetical protein
MATHWTQDPSIYAPDLSPGPGHDVEQDNLASQMSENASSSWQSLALDHRILSNAWQATHHLATPDPLQGYPLSSSHESNLRSNFHGTSLCLKYGHNSNPHTQRQDGHTSPLPQSATINCGALVPLLSSRISAAMVLCQLQVEVAPRFLVDLKVCLR